MCDCAEGRRGIYMCERDSVVQLVAYGGSVYGIGRMQCGSEGVYLVR